MSLTAIASGNFNGAINRGKLEHIERIFGTCELWRRLYGIADTSNPHLILNKNFTRANLLSLPHDSPSFLSLEP